MNVRRAWPAPAGDGHAERFTALRPLLFTIAYEILGSTTEADDVLQDSYLRWAAVDLAIVRDTRTYLARLVTRQALNAQRTRARRREAYVGPWLPEPLLIEPDDASSDLLLAESVSMAMLVLLESLTPVQRAVFVLHEVFGFGYDEIAGMVGRPTATVRQLAHRARRHVHARRRRFEPADAAATTRLAEQFLAAAETGELADLLTLLAPEVTWTADGGGKVTASRRPVIGADRVAAILIKLLGSARPADLRVELVVCNSLPTLIAVSGARVIGVFLIEIGAGKITNIFAVRNPDKLTTLGVIRPISR